MSSFQSKIGWKRLRKGENKLWLRSVPTRRGRENSKPVIENSKKIGKKIQKIKKYYYGFFSSQNRLEKAENRENKNYRYILFLPDGVEKIPKK